MAAFRDRVELVFGKPQQSGPRSSQRDDDLLPHRQQQLRHRTVTVKPGNGPTRSAPPPTVSSIGVERTCAESTPTSEPRTMPNT
jgi:hypothetical protein